MITLICFYGDKLSVFHTPKSLSTFVLFIHSFPIKYFPLCLILLQPIPSTLHFLALNSIPKVYSISESYLDLFVNAHSLLDFQFFMVIWQHLQTDSYNYSLFLSYNLHRPRTSLGPILIIEELHFSHCTILTSDLLLLFSFLCCSKSFIHFSKPPFNPPTFSSFQRYFVMLLHTLCLLPSTYLFPSGFSFFHLYICRKVLVNFYIFILYFSQSYFLLLYGFLHIHF